MSMASTAIKAVIFLIFLFIAVPITVTYWAYSQHQAPLENAETFLLVESGMSFPQIEAQLEEANLLSSKLLFDMAARVKSVDKTLKAGEYQIPANTSQADILEILSKGQTYKRYFTAIEGESVYQTVKKLIENNYLVGNLEKLPAEGALLPETYQYERGESRQAVLNRMRGDMQQTLDQLWVMRAPDLPIKTKDDAVILASVVEKETGLAAERPQVAAVFVNRLKKGMKLQADATTVYCFTKGRGALGRRLLKKDLETDCGYNTYAKYGLPVAPIANPSKESLAAVLSPPNTPYLYFVADGTGGHVFAETLDEHTRNVAKWRKIRREMEKNN